MPDEIHETNALLKEKVLLYVQEAGTFASPVNGLFLVRHDQANLLENCFYAPVIGVVLQGFKHSQIGNDEYRYGEHYCLVAGVDMPTVNRIVSASPEKPFLAISLRMDRRLAAQLSAELPAAPKFGTSYKGVSIAPVEAGVLDAFLRLVVLLEKPEQISVLAPMIIREIHYRILIGPQGGCMCQASTPGSQNNQIAQAVSWLRENYKEPVHIDELARMVEMGTSTFHRHFKQVTTFSPLQFQKRLRLHEAQRLMLSENRDAASASMAVGYESPTQFNREYKRLFGEPPHRDVSRMR